ncbi:hypothetical protein COCCU_07165 [Corynebacterium occultum]|uniref:Activator of Hsp90 ATPase homologue 1/2-like C-terminal domain-containing protein n=1 Tax=Corynebacterium occultum TaxID=2675219 RepID=A0A6B8W5X1_9CORY|nr:SRPBCC domain-containing protein [Corynebacterium occultum]QGU07367.1 hypothetical protein COCCU_07165 [Corynebacterium occultum]
MGAVEPTGTIIAGAEGPELLISRDFTENIKEVWAHVVESDRLAQWYGTWAGDPITGKVWLTMIEDPDSPRECHIHQCEAPHLLAVSISDSEGEWQIELNLSVEKEGTRLTFRQPLRGFEMAATEVGPGWEYYLDRLRASLAGGNVEEIDFSSYYPHQIEHYRA